MSAGNGGTAWIVSGKCEWCWAQNRGEGCDWADCGCSCHDDDDLDWHDDLEDEDA